MWLAIGWDQWSSRGWLPRVGGVKVDLNRLPRVLDPGDERDTEGAGISARVFASCWSGVFLGEVGLKDCQEERVGEDI